MLFGICSGPDGSAAVKAAGGDFVESNAQGLLQGEKADAEWTGMQQMAKAVLRVYAANMMVPGGMKITGPSVDLGMLKAYMASILRRAQRVGMKVIVFGSGGARNVPEGFDRDTARQQIIDFGKMIAPMALPCGITIVLEPLNRTECNIVNSVAEAMGYVRAVDHPNFQCLADSYHFWLENEPLDSLREAGPALRHVHVADHECRLAPGVSGQGDYKSFFRALKDASYDGVISIEASKFDVATDGARAIRFLRDQWNNA